MPRCDRSRTIRNAVVAAIALCVILGWVGCQPHNQQKATELSSAPPAIPAVGALLETRVISPGFVTLEIYRDEVPAEREEVLAVRYVYRIKGHIIPPIQTSPTQGPNEHEGIFGTSYVVTFTRGPAVPVPYFTVPIALPPTTGSVNVNGTSYKTHIKQVMQWETQ